MATKTDTSTKEVTKAEPTAAPVEAAATAESKPKTTAKKQTAPTGPVAYIGPNLPGGKLFQFAVFRNGKPAYVQQLIEECSALKFLFVPVSRLSVARQKLSDKTSVEYAKFAEASRHFAKGAN